MPIVNYIKSAVYKADMEHLALIDGYSWLNALPKVNNWVESIFQFLHVYHL